VDRAGRGCEEGWRGSRKAITTREVFNSINTGSRLVVAKADTSYLEFQTSHLESGKYTTGDYYCTISPSPDGRRRRIVGNWERGLKVDSEIPFDPPPSSGSLVQIQIRLQRPYVDPQRCIGCGICQHECPVPGKRAIRVTADGESRDRSHSLLL